MPRYALRHSAREDLKSIARYTQREWGVTQRNVYLRQLAHRFEWLAQNPTLGKRRDDIKEGYMCYPEGRHVIFYITGNDRIEIIGVLHESMDVVRHL